MGTNKAYLLTRGETFLERSFSLLREMCTDVVVLGDYEGYPCIPDKEFAQGPVAALRDFTHSHPFQRALVIPVDTPFLETRHLETLLRAEGSCYFEDSPLPAKFEVDQRFLEAIDVVSSFRELHEKVGSVSVPVASDVLLNVNTPKEYEQVRA